MSQLQETLVISAFVLKHVAKHASASGCTFASVSTVDVTVTGPAGPLPSATTADSVAVQLPGSPRPLDLSILITPTGPIAGTHWPVSAQIRYEGNGRWTDVSATPEVQLPPQILVQPSGFAVSFLSVFLSRLRDATQQIQSIVANPPHDRAQYGTGRGFQWSVRDELTNYVDSPPTAAGSILIESLQTRADPGTTSFVVEIRGFVAPRLLAVCWPNDVLSRPGAATPGHVHPRGGHAFSRLLPRRAQSEHRAAGARRSHRHAPLPEWGLSLRVGLSLRDHWRAALTTAAFCSTTRTATSGSATTRNIGTRVTP